MNKIIADIIKQKQEILNKRKHDLPLSEIKQRLPLLDKPRSFFAALDGNFAVIAEMKRASPSAGLLRKNYHPIELAKIFTAAGAAAISVLTEEKYFQGDIYHLLLTHETTSLPVLRKDFIFDEYQIYESMFFGADAILLLASVLDDQRLRDYIQLAEEINLCPLVEVHSEQELERVLKLPVKIIGINNRDLSDFSVDKERARRLRQQIPKNIRVIAESGLAEPEELRQLKKEEFSGVLIGTTLMRAENIFQVLKNFCEAGQ